MSKLTRTRTSIAAQTFGTACPGLADVCARYVRMNSGYESTAANEAAVDEVAGCGDLQAAAMAPVHRGVFGLAAAVQWGFFFKSVTDNSASLGEMPETWPTFDANQYFVELAGVYDLGMEAAVWEYFDDPEESDDSAADGEDGEDGEDDEDDGEDA